MTAAAITRGGQRKPAARKRAAPRRKGPSRLGKLLAAMPFSARAVEHAITWAIVAIAGTGVVAIVLMLGLPARLASATGEAIGRAGLAVQHIEITGIDRMDRMDVYAVALEQKSMAMPLVDLDAVRQRLLAYGWVADARVSRRLPDTLVVDIVERKPFAVWQHARQLTLVDANGVVLEPVKLDAMPDLPLVIGPDANVQATALTALMKNAPQLHPVVDSATWVGGRRWDLHFQSGETLMLPSGEVRAAAALREFARLDGQHRLLGQRVQHFDMRNDGRMFILPGEKRSTAPAAPATALST